MLSPSTRGSWIKKLCTEHERNAKAVVDGIISIKTGAAANMATLYTMANMATLGRILVDVGGSVH